MEYRGPFPLYDYYPGATAPFLKRLSVPHTIVSSFLSKIDRPYMCGSSYELSLLLEQKGLNNILFIIENN